MSTFINFKDNLGWLKSGKMLLLSIILGIIIGTQYPSFFENYKFITVIFLDILMLIVMPLILCSILLNIQKILADKINSKNGWYALYVFLLLSLLTAAVGILAEFIFQPGTTLSLNNIMNNQGIVSADLVNQVTKINFYTSQNKIEESLIDQIIRVMAPSNIFTSMAQGEIIKVAIFSLLFGFALSNVPTRLLDGFNQSLQSITLACKELCNILNYFSPFVLLIVISGITTVLSKNIVLVLGVFIATLMLSQLLLIIFSIIILKNRSQLNFIQILVALKPTISIAMASAENSLSLISQMIEALNSNMGFNRERVELFVPLVATFFRSSQILFFASATVFISQIYGHVLSVSEVFVILTLSIIHGFSSIGLRGQQKFVFLALICNPLGLPTESVFMLLLAIDPLCEITGSLSMVFLQCASVSMVCNKPIRF